MFKRIISVAILSLLLCGYSWNSGYNEGEIDAEYIRTDTSSFDGYLSATDKNVQEALDTIDNMVINNGDINWANIEGLANYLPKWGTTGTGLTDSILYDDGTNIGIGTTVPAAKLEVGGAVIIRTGGSANNAVCWKADGITLGYCSDTPDASGDCTCN